MAAGRRGNWIGQQRVDIPHLRAIESGVAGDLDVLGGNVVAGGRGVVLRGYELLLTGAVGSPADRLTIVVADSVAISYRATASGSVFATPSDRAPETVSPTNPRVVGGFTPGTKNFVGLDFVLAADPATADTVQFYRPDTGAEVAEDVPLAMVADYRISVSTADFSVAPGIVPVAIVTVDSSGIVTAVVDARQLLFRLGSGGSAPSDTYTYPWPGGRGSSAGGTAGDRAIRSLRDFVEAVESRIWETGGGPYWYSPTADRNVRLVSSNPYDLSSGSGFQIDSSPLGVRWRGLAFHFDNTPAYTNEIADQLTALPGLTDIGDGDVLYVDVDRQTNRLRSGTPLTVQRGRLNTLGVGPIPGSRWTIAWNIGGRIYLRDTANKGDQGDPGDRGDPGDPGTPGSAGTNGTDGQIVSFLSVGTLITTPSTITGGAWVLNGQINAVSSSAAAGEWPVPIGLEGNYQILAYVYAMTADASVTIQATVDGSLTGTTQVVGVGGVGTYTCSFTVPTGAQRHVGVNIIGATVSSGTFGLNVIVRRVP